MRPGADGDSQPARTAPPPLRPSSNGHGGPLPIDTGVPPAQRRDEAPSAGNGAAGTNGRITDRQLDAIVRIAHAKGLKPADIDGMSLRAFGRKAAQLGRADASSLIRELSNMKRSVAS
jgi:hypothetical protein